MINIDLDTFIHKPIGLVFDFVSAPENNTKWQYDTLQASGLAKGLGKVGMLFQSIGHLMGRRNLGAFEVIEYEPNRRFGFKSVSGPLQTRTSYTFEKTNDATKVNMSTRAKVIDFFQVNEGELELNMKMQGSENLALLKGLLEAM